MLWFVLTALPKAGFLVFSETIQVSPSTDQLYFNRSINISELENETLFVQEEVAAWIWKILSPIVLVVGLFGNILIIMVMCRMKFWKKMTYLLLFILALSDTTVLCTGLIRKWISAVFNFDIRDVSDAGCKFHVFMIYFSMHFSSWTLVTITFERFLITRDPFRKYRVGISKILKYVYSLSILFTIAIDTPLFATNGLMPSEGGFVCNNTSEEYYNYEEKYFVFIDLAWLSFLPFIMMLIMNIFVGQTIQSLTRRQATYLRDGRYRERQGRKNKRLTRMLFYTSIYFLVATMPAQINFVFHTFLSATTTPSKQTQANLELSTAILYMLQFTNYSVNFYIYIKCKPSFQKNLPFCLGRSSKQRSTSMPFTTLSNTLRTSLGSSMTITDNTAVAQSSTLEFNSTQNGNVINSGHLSSNSNHRSNGSNYEDLDGLVEEELHITTPSNLSINKPLSGISTIAALVTGINIVSVNGGIRGMASVSEINTLPSSETASVVESIPSNGGVSCAVNVSKTNRLPGNSEHKNTFSVSEMHTDKIVIYPDIDNESRNGIIETTYL